MGRLSLVGALSSRMACAPVVSPSGMAFHARMMRAAHLRRVSLMPWPWHSLRDVSATCSSVVWVVVTFMVRSLVVSVFSFDRVVERMR